MPVGEEYPTASCSQTVSYFWKGGSRRGPMFQGRKIRL